MTRHADLSVPAFGTELDFDVQYHYTPAEEGGPEHPDISDQIELVAIRVPPALDWAPMSKVDVDDEVRVMAALRKHVEKEGRR